MFNHARIIVSGKIRNKKYSGKINNLLAGIEKVSKDADIVIFADSGCQYPKYWLYFLTKTHLINEGSVSTSFFWAYSDVGVWSELVAWMTNTYPLHRFLVPNYSLLWGGAMCFSKKFLDQIDLKKIWENVVYDDLTLSTFLQRGAFKAYFVFHSIAKRKIRMNFNQALSWQIRQLTAVKYYQNDWWVEIKKESLGLIFVCLLPFWVFLSVFSSLSVFAVILPIVIIFSRLLSGIYMYNFFENQTSWKKVFKFFFLDILAIPFSLLVGCYVLKSKQIVWAGRKYNLSEDGKIIKVTNHG